MVPENVILKEKSLPGAGLLQRSSATLLNEAVTVRSTLFRAGCAVHFSGPGPDR